MTLLDYASRPETLYAAFLKARSWLWEQTYYDAVELQLFEWRLGRNLRLLGKRMRDGYAWSPLLGFHLPKDLKSSRRFAYRSLPDEVASVAAALVLGKRLEPAMDAGGQVSFGNRLDPSWDSDRLFLTWEVSWRRFTAAAARRARVHPWYLRTDVKNFYPEIPLDRLDAVLQRVLPKDPLTAMVRSMNRQPRPMLDPRHGLPVGPAVSGFLANLYLLPLDRTVKGAWRAGGRFVRYVDDMFYFADSAAGARAAQRSLARLVQTRFGLRLHDAKKTEFGWSREPLGSGRREDPGSPEAFFDRVFAALYHVSPKLRRRFRAEPDRMLRWYVRGLRWLGINVSTDWLAQRLLSVEAKGSRSRWALSKGRYRLDIPDIELFGIERHGMRSWAEDFRRRNPVFMRDLHRLQVLMLRRTRESYRELGDVRRQEKKALKGRIFALRQYAGRLAMLRPSRAGDVYAMLIDHPWILDPALTVQAFLAMPHGFERLAAVLGSDKPALLRAKAAWALGELGDPRAARPLWDAAIHGRGDVMRRSSLEALLRLDVFRGISPDWVRAEAQSERDPAIRKYHYLILGRMKPEGVSAFLKACAEREKDFMAGLALEYAAADTGSLYHVVGHLAHHRGPTTAIRAGHPVDKR